jgi:hypothetical protein
MSLMTWTLGFVIVNIILLVYLALFHLNHVRKIKSGFTLGLLIFVLVFLIQNLMAAYFYLTMMPLYVSSVEIPVFVTTVIETLAFLIYVWISRH